jgi:hypothetical protein
MDAIFSIQQASGSAKQVQMAFFKNGTELTGSRMIATADSGQWHVITLKFNTTMATNDYLEVFIKVDANATINFASGYLRISGIAA